MKMTRRSLLRYASAAGLSAATIGTLGNALTLLQSANAAETSGYKALVCLFFLGGMDTHDIVLPYDQVSYDRYADIRSSLLGLYTSMPGGSTRSRDRLLQLHPANATNFGSRQFALTEEFTRLHQLFEQGDAAIVGNVGPLIEPLTKDQFLRDNGRIPKRLFSHNDQQSTWMANEPEGAQFGWGGRIADAAIASNANGNDAFAAVTTLGNDVFLTGESARPYQLGLDGATEYDLLTQFGYNRETAQGEEAYQLLRAHFAAQNFRRSHLIEQDVADVMLDAIDVNEAYNSALESAFELPVAFNDDDLGRQLNAVARTIQIRSALQMRRQVFFVGIGGFDTHSAQATTLPALQRSIDAGVFAFFHNMVSLGLGADVTLFTASDFGRTLAINGDGTDHGWGSHHFVVGGGVNGNRIYGNIPPYDLDHDWDVGSGRLLPSVSVEQFAAPMARWFGLNDAEIARALPNLANFVSEPALSFML